MIFKNNQLKNYSVSCLFIILVCYFKFILNYHNIVNHNFIFSLKVTRLEHDTNFFD